MIFRCRGRQSRLLGRTSLWSGPLPRRLFHSVPELEISKEVGVPGLLSPQGYRIAWSDYQKHLVDNINRLLEKSSEFQNESTMYDLMTRTLAASADPVAREIAYYASQAYNNEFFFRSIRPSADPNSVIGNTSTDGVDVKEQIYNKPPTTKTQGMVSRAQSFSPVSARSLGDKVNESFDSVEALRELMINRGNYMFGNGYVWLIHNNTDLSLVNTYNWASPHASEGAREGLDSYEDLVNVQNTVASFQPVLCLNAWQHVYLHDYGVTGKQSYLRNLFECLDWDMASSRVEAAKIDHGSSLNFV